MGAQRLILEVYSATSLCLFLLLVLDLGQHATECHHLEQCQSARIDDRPRGRMCRVRPYHRKMAQNPKTSILPLRMRLAESQRPAKFYAAKLNFMQRFGGTAAAHRLWLCKTSTFCSCKSFRAKDGR